MPQGPSRLRLLPDGRRGDADRPVSLRPGRASKQTAKLVSCLTVTRQRVRLLRRAIRCFQQQTYQARELVIVCDADDGTEALIQRLGDEHIRLVRLRDAGLSLGELRNIALEEARGPY